MSQHTPNKAPKNKIFYPFYFICGKTLLAMIGTDEMYKIETFGKSDRVTIDHLKSRKSVLQYWPYGKQHKEVTANNFKHFFNKYFSTVVSKIVDHEK